MVARKAVRLAGMASILIALPALLQAGTLGLAWDATEGATGYKVHYGTASGQYTTSRDVGNVTQTTLTTLTDCRPWYLAVTAYNGAGESAYSEEVSSLPRPSLTGATPTAAKQGTQFNLRLNGANFEPGASVTIDNPNVFLDGVSVTSCNEISMVATVEPSAPGVRAAEVGRFTLTVAAANGLSGSMTQGFEVQIEPARFDLDKAYDCTSGWLDGWDVAALSAVFRSEYGDALYRADVDLDGDGMVDGNDLAYLTSAFGKNWSGSAWVAKSPRPVCNF